MTEPINVADNAPDFTLPSQNGSTVSLSSFRGKKWVVLYFYPKDETRWCTAQSCAFRDSYARFQDAGAEVIGISGDGVASHAGFAKHHNLPFLLVSDLGGGVRKRYGVPSFFGLMPGRVTYVIDMVGIVQHVFSSQLRPLAHIQEALDIITKT